MKKIILPILVIIFFTACTHETIENNKTNIEQDNNIQIEDYYIEKLNYYEEQINYYENLCDEYGYQTYEMIYSPEKWHYYCNERNDIYYHTDWLCEKFNNNNFYYSSANPATLERKGFIKCSNCNLENSDICFLDVKENILHKDKNHLNLGTRDFISPDVNYKFVSYSCAIINNIMLCEKCFQKNV